MSREDEQIKKVRRSTQFFPFEKKLPSVIESSELNEQTALSLQLSNTSVPRAGFRRSERVKTGIFRRIVPSIFVTERAMTVHVIYTLPEADFVGGACTRTLSRRSCTYTYTRLRCDSYVPGVPRYVAPGGTIIQQKNRETFVRPPLIPKLLRHFWRICIKP